MQPHPNHVAHGTRNVVRCQVVSREVIEMTVGVLSNKGIVEIDESREDAVQKLVQLCGLSEEDAVRYLEDSAFERALYQACDKNDNGRELFALMESCVSRGGGEVQRRNAPIALVFALSWIAAHGGGK